MAYYSQKTRVTLDANDLRQIIRFAPTRPLIRRAHNRSVIIGGPKRRIFIKIIGIKAPRVFFDNIYIYSVSFHNCPRFIPFGNKVGFLFL